MASRTRLAALALILTSVSGKPYSEMASPIIETMSLPTPVGVQSPPSTAAPSMIDECDAFSAIGFQISCAPTPLNWPSVHMPIPETTGVVSVLKPRHGRPIVVTDPLSYPRPLPTGFPDGPICFQIESAYVDQYSSVVDNKVYPCYSVGTVGTAGTVSTTMSGYNMPSQPPTTYPTVQAYSLD